MDLDKVQALLRLVNESGVAEVEVEEGGLKIIVRRHSPTVTLQQAGQAMGGFPMQQPFPVQTGYPPMPPPMPPTYAPPPSAPPVPTPSPTASEASAAASAPAAEPGSGADEILIRAPIVGTFYRAPSPEADPFVKVGAKVGEGDPLCIIEAMKLMNEVTSEHSGTIKEILVENAQAVEYDQPLFVLSA